MSAGKIKIITPGELPDAIPVSLSELRNPKWDCHYVEVTGLIKQAVLANVVASERMNLTVQTADGKISAFVGNDDGIAPDHILDASVKIRGVVIYYNNNKRQAIQPTLQVADKSAISIMEDPPRNRFAVRSVPLEKFSQFTPEGIPGGRVKISGIVTFVKKNAFLYVQHGDVGLRVEAYETQGIKLRDKIEASGYAEMGDSFAFLGSALLRKVGTGSLPTPFPINGQEAARSFGSARSRKILVISSAIRHAKGTLIGKGSIAYRYYVQSVGGTISVELERGSLGTGGIEIGSVLEFTGICRTNLEYGGHRFIYPRVVSMSMMVQDPGFITVIARPPWWIPSAFGSRRESASSCSAIGRVDSRPSKSVALLSAELLVSTNCAARRDRIRRYPEREETPCHRHPRYGGAVASGVQPLEGSETSTASVQVWMRCFHRRWRPVGRRSNGRAIFSISLEFSKHSCYLCRPPFDSSSAPHMTKLHSDLSSHQSRR